MYHRNHFLECGTVMLPVCTLLCTRALDLSRLAKLKCSTHCWLTCLYPFRHLSLQCAEFYARPFGKSRRGKDRLAKGQ